MFLDEATSALDEAREQEMYELLRRQLPAMRVVSVGHRSTLFARHGEELPLFGDGGGEILDEPALEADSGQGMIGMRRRWPDRRFPCFFRKRSYTIDTIGLNGMN